MKVAVKTGHEATAGCAAANGEWQAVQGAVTLPADATGFWILLRTQQAGTYYVDDVQVGGLPEAGVYRREDAADHTLWSRSVYDELGRLVQEQAEKDGDRAIVVHRSYDELGRLAEESVPLEVSGNIKLYHMGARFYYASIGCFVSPDTLVPDPSSPQSLNRYSHVNNRHVDFRDPRGHIPIPQWIDRVVKALNTVNDAIAYLQTHTRVSPS